MIRAELMNPDQGKDGNRYCERKDQTSSFGYPKNLPAASLGTRVEKLSFCHHDHHKR